MCKSATAEIRAMTRQQLLTSLILAVSCASLVFAQDRRDSPTGAGAVPEMTRLANALAGDWNNVESMESSEWFPNGGERKGTSHCGVGTGGTTLICQGDSDGSAGRLDHLIVIWWDKDTNLYRFFTCFKDRGSGCEIRGTGHWQADTFVNDYTENVKGKQKRMRDSFIDITANSHTLIEAIEIGDRNMLTLITTKSSRRSR